MPVYRYDHVHLRSPDPEAAARFFETMFGAEVVRGTYAAGTFFPGQPRVYVKLGGQTVLIAPPHHDEPTGAEPRFPYFGLEHIGLTVDDIDAAVADLRAKGADIAIGPMDYSDGTRLAFIRGPEGVMVEIVQRT
jgi:lactoylglutathione lyase